MGGVGGGGGHEATNVDEEVEPQHSALSGVLRVLNDTLATLEGFDNGDVVRHLIQEEGGNVGLEHGCTKKEAVSTLSSRC